MSIENIIQKINDADQISNCIAKSSNLMEGIINKKAKRSKGTMGDSLNRCKGIFPHESLKQSVENIYVYYSDYPNIRHSGNPKSKLRDLKKDDALLSILLTLSYGNYIFSNNSSNRILNGKI